MNIVTDPVSLSSSVFGGAARLAFFARPFGLATWICA
jgi:hypothetical protein